MTPNETETLRLLLAEVLYPIGMLTLIALVLVLSGARVLRTADWVFPRLIKLATRLRPRSQKESM